LFGKTPLKAQNDYIFKTFWEGMAPLAPPGYAYVDEYVSFRLSVTYVQLFLLPLVSWANKHKIPQNQVNAVKNCGNIVLARAQQIFHHCGLTSEAIHTLPSSQVSKRTCT